MPSDADQEREATMFAMELLMPEAWLRRDAGALDVEDDGENIRKLALRYQVSVQVMTVRLAQLGLFDLAD